MANYSRLKVAELKDELEKRSLSFAPNAKKQDLIDALEQADAAASVATAGFDPPILASGAGDPPKTASDAFSAPAPALPNAESSAEPTAAAASSGNVKEPAPASADGNDVRLSPSGAALSTDPSAQPTTRLVPESTAAATFPYPADAAREDEASGVPSGPEESAGGADEARGEDVTRTGEEEVVLGAGGGDAEMPPAAEGEKESAGEDVPMNDAAEAVPVATAPAAAPAGVPTPPPPTPAKRSASPLSPATKRSRIDSDLPLPSNFLTGAHPPTTALYISGLRRPLPDTALVDLLEEFGELDADAGVGKGAGRPERDDVPKEGWWVSPVKSHAFAAFTTAEAARAAYESLLGKTDFPPDAPKPAIPLSCTFLPASAIPELIAQEEQAWLNGRKKLELRVVQSEAAVGGWEYTYEGAGDVNLSGSRLNGTGAPRAAGAGFPPGGAGRGGFGNGWGARGGYNGAGSSLGGFGASRGGFGGSSYGPSRGGGSSGRGFMDRSRFADNATSTRGGPSSSYGHRPYQPPSPPEHFRVPSRQPAGRSPRAYGSARDDVDEGRAPPFRVDEDARGGWARRDDPPHPRGAYPSTSGGRGSYRGADSYRPRDERESGRGDGGWGARRRSPSPPPRGRYDRRSPSPGGRRSRSPSRGRGGW